MSDKKTTMPCFDLSEVEPANALPWRLHGEQQKLPSGVLTGRLISADLTGWGMFKDIAQSWPKLHRLDVVYEAPPVQFRFPRSKKKRIRKKWAKNPRNWRKGSGQMAVSMPVEMKVEQHHLLVPDDGIKSSEAIELKAAIAGSMQHQSVLPSVVIRGFIE